MPYKDLEKQKAALARYFQENKAQLNKARNQKRSLMRRRIEEAKEGKPCQDCGESFPHYVMDFDHVRGKKRFNIGKPGQASSMQILEEEIAKCELVCSNCHRHRTFMRQVKIGGR